MLLSKTVIAIHGTYQQGALLLDEPVNLPEGAQVRVALEPEPAGSVSRAEADDLLSDGRPWPKTPEELAAFLVEMEATPGLEFSDEEYAWMETERLAHARGGVGLGRGEFRGARSSRVLVSASRRDGLSATHRFRDRSRNRQRRGREVSFGGTPKPALGTSALPGFRSRTATALRREVTRTEMLASRETFFPGSPAHLGYRAANAAG